MILSVTHSTANRIDALNRFFPYLPISGEYDGIGLGLGSVLFYPGNIIIEFLERILLSQFSWSI